MVGGGQWDGPKIKTLRLRLGWSQAELARRLQVESIHVLDWEEEITLPEDGHRQQLELLSRQAEMSADEMSVAPLLEVFIEEGDLSQCDFDSTRQRDKN